KVDFVPVCAASFAASDSRQDHELEGACTDAVAGAQSLHECRDLDIGQSRVMPDPADFGPGRQEMIQVPTPARGIFSISEPTNFGPVEYGFHPTADAARRFRLVFPDGVEHLHDQLGVDLGNG